MPDLTLQVVRKINHETSFSGMKEARRIQRHDIISVRSSERRGEKQANGKYVGDHSRDSTCYYIHLTGVPDRAVERVEGLANPLEVPVVPVVHPNGKADTVDPGECVMIRQHAHCVNFPELPTAIRREIKETGQATVPWREARPFIRRKKPRDHLNRGLDNLEAAVANDVT